MLSPGHDLFVPLYGHRTLIEAKIHDQLAYRKRRRDGHRLTIHTNVHALTNHASLGVCQVCWKAEENRVQNGLFEAAQRAKQGPRNV